MKRGIFDVIFFMSLFIFPWWLGVLLAFIGIFIFKDFYEFIISGIIIYSLYIIPGNNLITSLISFFTITVVLYISIQILRRKIILYNNNGFSYK